MPRRHDYVDGEDSERTHQRGQVFDMNMAWLIEYRAESGVRLLLVYFIPTVCNVHFLSVREKRRKSAAGKGYARSTPRIMIPSRPRTSR
jgi:hypothetical protein